LNTPSTAIFYGQMIGGLIENFGKSIDFSGNDPTLNSNANAFVD